MTFKQGAKVIFNGIKDTSAISNHKLYIHDEQKEHKPDRDKRLNEKRT